MSIDAARFGLACVILAWVIGEGYHALRRRVLKHRGYYLIEAAPDLDRCRRDYGAREIEALRPRR